MAKTYEQADSKVLDILDQARNRWHPILIRAGVAIDVLMVSEVEEGSGTILPALKHHGYAAAATIKIVPLAQRVLGQGDALLTIDRATWNDLKKAERLALIDHELEHIGVRADVPGGLMWIDDGKVMGIPMVDDQNRPKLKLRLHDWQLGGFRSVAQRHQEHALEVKAIRACVDEDGQAFWDWTPVAEAAE